MPLRLSGEPVQAACTQETNAAQALGSSASCACLQVCSGCHMVRYCSKKCQRLAWPRHAQFCRDVTSAERAEPAKKTAEVRMILDVSEIIFGS